MTNFIKRFKNTPYEDIRREARFQRKAAELGLSPRVIRCNKNSIIMENLNKPCIADQYGDNIDDIPEWIQEEILAILFTLYLIGIEYVDVTPYNFIEKDNKIWIIDFGHARNVPDYVDDYIDDLFANWKLKWNSDFA
jgi:tRNA A-37 threonylcarbamoyl transferase component Bud32